MFRVFSFRGKDTKPRNVINQPPYTISNDFLNYRSMTSVLNVINVILENTKSGVIIMQSNILEHVDSMTVVMFHVIFAYESYYRLFSVNPLLQNDVGKLFKTQ